MRVLITGGAGFVGSHLADRLLARGDEVTVLDNLATGNIDNVDPKAELLVGDITQIDDIMGSRHDFDVVVHAAASYKNPTAWVEDSRTNTFGTALITNWARRAFYGRQGGGGRLIYLQTALCYGLYPKSPVSRNAILDPWDSSYAISKTAGEAIIRKSDLDWISFRLANAYGPRNVSGPLPAFYKKLAAKERCTVVRSRRDFMYIQDLIDLLEKAVDGSGASQQVYHASSGRDDSVVDLFYETCAAMGVVGNAEFIPPPEGDAPSILLDPAATNNAFDWEPHVPLRIGVQAAVNYYREYGVGETYTHLKLED